MNDILRLIDMKMYYPHTRYITLMILSIPAYDINYVWTMVILPPPDL